MTRANPATGFERKEAVLIINPTAHNVPPLRRMREAEDWLRETGWRFRWEQTARAGQATEIAARAAREGIPLVIACGGDGTLNETANGLAGTDTALGMLPFGTSNIWARETSISRRSPLEAVQLIASGERRLIDLGKAGSRYFVLFAGVGADAQVTRDVPLDLKRHVGAAAYIMTGIREVVRWRSRPVLIRLDGVVHTVNMLQGIISNVRLYGGVTRPTPRAVVDDGLLDICIYQGQGTRDLLLSVAQTFAQAHGKASRTLYKRARRIEFDWNEPLPIQLDGDYAGPCPDEITVADAALWVVVPAGLKSSLFSGRATRQAPELSLTQPQTG